jgi:beta-glucuronidase
MAGCFFVFLLPFYTCFAQDPQITNIENREGITLNGVWKYLVDPYETGYYDYRHSERDQQSNPNPSESFFMNYTPQNSTERVEYNFDRADNILVPHDWNSQKEKLFYYEGSIWYYKSFNYHNKQDNKRYFICFGAANYEADVYLNGKKLGKHIGGFTPFNFEITGLLNPSGNFLILKVDNSRGIEKVPTINTDWWNYGGITRDVKIIELPETFIQDYYIQLNKDNDHLIDIEIMLNGEKKENHSVNLSIPDSKINSSFITNNEGLIKTSIKISKLDLWASEHPVLHNIQLSIDADTLTDKIGFRSLKTNGPEILINNQPVFLRGISIHEENGIRGGRAYSKEDAFMLLGWAKELGCNFVRLAHYPHNENMIRVADEMGIMVWAEIPVYWTIQWENKETYKNAETQLKELITRDKNKASVIIWSVANETPISPTRTQFLKRLIDKANELDPVRLVSAAMEHHTKKGTTNTHEIGDPLQEFVDIIAFNEYIGWYDGKPDKCKKVEFDINFNKPVIVSEFGGDALQGNHGTKDEVWTEEHQKYLYEETLKMLEKIPQLRGITPWILADFRSPRRLLPDIQNGWNRKGLISETGDKKKAFFVLQKYYQKKKQEFQPLK